MINNNPCFALLWSRKAIFVMRVYVSHHSISLRFSPRHLHGHMRDDDVTLEFSFSLGTFWNWYRTQRLTGSLILTGAWNARTRSFRWTWISPTDLGDKSFSIWPATWPPPWQTKDWPCDCRRESLSADARKSPPHVVNNPIVLHCAQHIFPLFIPANSTCRR